MSIMMPPDLNWFWDIVGGSDWPQGDEDKMFAAAQEASDIQGSLNGAGEGFGTLNQQVAASVGGTVGRNFFRFGQQLGGYNGDFEQAMGGQQQMLYSQALNLQNAKYSLLTQVAFTAAEILWALADPVTSELVPGFIAEGRAAVAKLLTRFFGRMGEFILSAAEEAMQEVFQDLLVQLEQIAKNGGGSINVSSLVQSAATGAAGGAFAHGAHSVLHKYAPKFSKSILGAAVVEGSTELAIGLGSLPLGGDASGLGWSVLNGGLSGAATHAAEHVHHKEEEPNEKKLPNVGKGPSVPNVDGDNVPTDFEAAPAYTPTANEPPPYSPTAAPTPSGVDTSEPPPYSPPAATPNTETSAPAVTPSSAPAAEGGLPGFNTHTSSTAEPAASHEQAATNEPVATNAPAPAHSSPTNAPETNAPASSNATPTPQQQHQQAGPTNQAASPPPATTARPATSPAASPAEPTNSTPPPVAQNTPSPTSTSDTPAPVTDQATPSPSPQSGPSEPHITTETTAPAPNQLTGGPVSGPTGTPARTSADGPSVPNPHSPDTENGPQRWVEHPSSTTDVHDSTDPGTATDNIGPHTRSANPGPVDIGDPHAGPSSSQPGPAPQHSAAAAPNVFKAKTYLAHGGNEVLGISYMSPDHPNEEAENRNFLFAPVRYQDRYYSPHYDRPTMSDPTPPVEVAPWAYHSDETPIYVITHGDSNLNGVEIQTVGPGGVVQRTVLTGGEFGNLLRQHTAFMKAVTDGPGRPIVFVVCGLGNPALSHAEDMVATLRSHGVGNEVFTATGDVYLNADGQWGALAVKPGDVFDENHVAPDGVFRRADDPLLQGHDSSGNPVDFYASWASSTPIRHDGEVVGVAYDGHAGQANLNNFTAGSNILTDTSYVRNAGPQNKTVVEAPWSKPPFYVASHIDNTASAHQITVDTPHGPREIRVDGPTFGKVVGSNGYFQTASNADRHRPVVYLTSHAAHPGRTLGHDTANAADDPGVRRPSYAPTGAVTTFSANQGTVFGHATHSPGNGIDGEFAEVSTPRPPSPDWTAQPKPALEWAANPDPASSESGSASGSDSDSHVIEIGSAHNSDSAPGSPGSPHHSGSGSDVAGPPSRGTRRGNGNGNGPTRWVQDHATHHDSESQAGHDDTRPHALSGVPESVNLADPHAAPSTSQQSTFRAKTYTDPGSGQVRGISYMHPSQQHGERENRKFMMAATRHQDRYYSPDYDRPTEADPSPSVEVAPWAYHSDEEPIYVITHGDSNLDGVEIQTVGQSGAIQRRILTGREFGNLLRQHEDFMKAVTDGPGRPIVFVVCGLGHPEMTHAEDLVRQLRRNGVTNTVFAATGDAYVQTRGGTSALAVKPADPVDQNHDPIPGVYRRVDDPSIRGVDGDGNAVRFFASAAEFEPIYHDNEVVGIAYEGHAGQADLGAFTQGPRIVTDQSYLPDAATSKTLSPSPWHSQNGNRPFYVAAHVDQAGSAYRLTIRTENGPREVLVDGPAFGKIAGANAHFQTASHDDRERPVVYLTNFAAHPDRTLGHDAANAADDPSVRRPSYAPTGTVVTFTAGQNKGHAVAAPNAGVPGDFRPVTTPRPPSPAWTSQPKPNIEWSPNPDSDSDSDSDAQFIEIGSAQNSDAEPGSPDIEVGSPHHSDSGDESQDPRAFRFGRRTPAGTTRATGLPTAPPPAHTRPYRPGNVIRHHDSVRDTRDEHVDQPMHQGTDAGGHPVTFGPGDVDIRPLVDHQNQVIGVQFTSTRPDFAAEWAAAPIRHSDTGYIPDYDPNAEHAEAPDRHVQAPWGNRPFYVDAHTAGMHHVEIMVNTAPKGAPPNFRAVHVDGATHGKLVAGNRHFQQASGADRDRPIVYGVCEAGHPDSSVGADSVAQLRAAGHTGDVFTATGEVLPQIMQDELVSGPPGAEWVRYEWTGDSWYGVLPAKADAQGNRVPSEFRRQHPDGTERVPTGPLSPRPGGSATASGTPMGTPRGVKFEMRTPYRVDQLPAQRARRAQQADQPVSGTIASSATHDLKVGRSGNQAYLKFAAKPMRTVDHDPADHHTPAEVRQSLEDFYQQMKSAENGDGLDEILANANDLAQKFVLMGPESVSDSGLTFGVDVPIAGVRGLYDFASGHQYPYAPRVKIAASAGEFGDRLAAHFVGLDTKNMTPAQISGALDKLSADADVESLRGHGRIVFSHIAAKVVTTALPVAHDGVLHVSSTTSLDGLRRALPPAVQDYLNANAGDIRTLAARTLRSDFDNELELAHTRGYPVDNDADVLGMPTYAGSDGTAQRYVPHTAGGTVHHTIDDYLTNGITTSGRVINQHDAIGADEHADDTDDLGGARPHPVTELKVRHFESPLLFHQRLVEHIDTFTTTARDLDTRAQAAGELRPKTLDSVNNTIGLSGDDADAHFNELANHVSQTAARAHVTGGPDANVRISGPDADAARDRLTDLVRQKLAERGVPDASFDVHAEPGDGPLTASVHTGHNAGSPLPGPDPHHAIPAAPAGASSAMTKWHRMITKAGRGLESLSDKERNALYIDARKVTGPEFGMPGTLDPAELSPAMAARVALRDKAVELIAHQIQLYRGHKSQLVRSTWESVKKDFGHELDLPTDEPSPYTVDDRSDTEDVDISRAELPSLLNRHTDQHTPAPSGPRPPLTISDVVPDEKDWWRLYINPNDHAAALEKAPDNPGQLYDQQKSPGFQNAMVNAYRDILTGTKPPELSWTGYQDLHKLVTLDTAGQFGLSTAGGVSFGLHATSAAPDTVNERVNGRPLMVTESQLTGRAWPPGGRPLTSYAFSPKHNTTHVTVQYDKKELPGLVDSVFDNYRGDIAAATTDHERLVAIARVVRDLHVMHTFGDGNGRLNVFLMLPHLLMSNGFHPMTRTDTPLQQQIAKHLESFFNGGYNLDQIATALRLGQPGSDEHLHAEFDTGAPGDPGGAGGVTPHVDTPQVTIQPAGGAHHNLTAPPNARIDFPEGSHELTPQARAAVRQQADAAADRAIALHAGGTGDRLTVGIVGHANGKSAALGAVRWGSKDSGRDRARAVDNEFRTALAHSLAAKQGGAAHPVTVDHLTITMRSEGRGTAGESVADRRRADITYSVGQPLAAADGASATGNGPHPGHAIAPGPITGTHDGQQITFSPDQVHKIVLHDAHGDPIGVSFGRPDEADALLHWASRPTRELDSHYLPDYTGDAARKPVATPWAQHSTKTPFYVQTHSRSDRFQVHVESGDGRHATVELDDTEYEKLLRADQHFMRAAGEESGRPIVFLACHTANPDGTALPGLVGRFEGDGLPGPYYGPTGEGVRLRWADGPVADTSAYGVRPATTTGGDTVPGTFRRITGTGADTSPSKPTGPPESLPGRQGHTPIESGDMLAESDSEGPAAPAPVPAQPVAPSGSVAPQPTAGPSNLGPDDIRFAGHLDPDEAAQLARILNNPAAHRDSESPSTPSSPIEDRETAERRTDMFIDASANNDIGWQLANTEVDDEKFFQQLPAIYQAVPGFDIQAPHAAFADQIRAIVGLAVQTGDVHLLAALQQQALRYSGRSLTDVVPNLAAVWVAHEFHQAMTRWSFNPNVERHPVRFLNQVRNRPEILAEIVRTQQTPAGLTNALQVHFPGVRAIADWVHLLVDTGDHQGAAIAVARIADDTLSLVRLAEVYHGVYGRDIFQDVPPLAQAVTGVTRGTADSPGWTYDQRSAWDVNELQNALQGLSGNPDGVNIRFNSFVENAGYRGRILPGHAWVEFRLPIGIDPGLQPFYGRSFTMGFWPRGAIQFDQLDSQAGFVRSPDNEEVPNSVVESQVSARQVQRAIDFIRSVQADYSWYGNNCTVFMQNLNTAMTGTAGQLGHSIGPVPYSLTGATVPRPVAQAQTFRGTETLTALPGYDGSLDRGRHAALTRFVNEYAGVVERSLLLDDPPPPVQIFASAQAGGWFGPSARALALGRAQTLEREFRRLLRDRLINAGINRGRAITALNVRVNLRPHDVSTVDFASFQIGENNA